MKKTILILGVAFLFACISSCSKDGEDCHECHIALENANGSESMWHIESPSGGEEFSYIPALNDSDEHIDVLSSIIQLHFKGWDTKIESSNCSSERAKKLGSTQ